MLWTLLAILLVMWLVGMLAGIGGAFIHLLLALAFVVLIINVISGRRTYLG